MDELLTQIENAYNDDNELRRILATVTGPRPTYAADILALAELRIHQYMADNARERQAWVAQAYIDARDARDEAMLPALPPEPQPRQHAAFVNWQELKRSLSAHPLRVQVDRQRNPDGWVLIINELGISAHGWTFEEATTQLAVEAAEQARQVLGMWNAPPASRDVALRIWMAEVEGELEQLLQDAAEAYDPGA